MRELKEELDRVVDKILSYRPKEAKERKETEEKSLIQAKEQEKGTAL